MEMNNSYNEAYFLGYVSKAPAEVTEKDVLKSFFELSVLNKNSQSTIIRVINKLDIYRKLIVSLRENDVIQIKGHLQISKAEGVYLYVIDILKLNSTPISKDKAITRLLAHPELNNNVYLNGTAINDNKIEVERQSKFKSITKSDVLNVDGFYMEAGKNYSLCGTLFQDQIIPKENKV